MALCRVIHNYQFIEDLTASIFAAGPDKGAGQPGSCPGSQHLWDAKTSLE